MDHFDYETPGQSKQLHINDRMRSCLDEFGRWGKILAIISFIVIGLIVIVMLFGVIIITPMDGGIYSSLIHAPEVFMLLSYVLVLIFCFIPSLYLYRSAGSIRKAMRLDDDIALLNGFRNLKNLFKFVAIFSVVAIGLYLLFILIVFIISF